MEAGVATISTKGDEVAEGEEIEGGRFKEVGQMVGVRVIIKMEEEEGTMGGIMVGNKGKEGLDTLQEDIKGKGTKVQGGIMGKGIKVEGVIKVKDTKVEGTKEGIKGRDTKVGGIKGVTKVKDILEEVIKEGKKVVIKVITKMEGDKSEEGVEGDVEEGDEEDEAGKAAAGVEEEGRILTKEGSLSSSSNMVGISITRQGSGRAFTPAELSLGKEP